MKIDTVATASRTILDNMRDIPSRRPAKDMREGMICDTIERKL